MRAAEILGVGRDYLRKYCKQNGIKPSPAGAAHPSPRVQHLQNHVRKLEQADKTFRELSESIKSAAETAPAPVLRSVNLRTKAKTLFSTPVDVVLHVSDMQFGEVVHPEQVPGGNYSPDIFRDERLPRYMDGATKLLESVASQHPIDRLWIAQGGDFTEGEGVFKGQQWHLALDAGQQVAQLGVAWATAVANLASTAKELSPGVKVNVVCVPGNHGVHGGRSAGAVPPSMSYDYLTYQMVHHILEPTGLIDFYDTEAHAALYFESAGHVFLLTHGDQDRGGNGVAGVPVVSMFKNDLTVRQSTGLNHRYHLSGHVHRPTSFTIGGDSERLVNGDWCGPNNLSTGRGGGSEPTQRAYVVHPDYGVSQVWPIRLVPGMSRTTPPVLH